MNPLLKLGVDGGHPAVTLCIVKCIVAAQRWCLQELLAQLSVVRSGCLPAYVVAARGDAQAAETSVCWTGTRIASCRPHDGTVSWQVVMMCLYGGDTTVRLKQLGMEFAVWTFKHATEANLTSVAAFTFKQLLSLLDEGARSINRTSVFGTDPRRPRHERAIRAGHDQTVTDLPSQAGKLVKLVTLEHTNNRFVKRGPQLELASVMRCKSCRRFSKRARTAPFAQRLGGITADISPHAAHMPWVAAAQSARPTWPAGRCAASPTRPLGSWRRGCRAWRGSGWTSRRCDRTIDW